MFVSRFWEKKKNNEQVYLPVEENNLDEIVGYKVAYIKDLKNLEFESLFSGSYFWADSFACPNNHTEPEEKCSCGFHSFATLKQALVEFSNWRQTVYLKVQNYGKVIIHQAGYRTETQVLDTIYYTKRCSKTLCYAETQAFGKNENIFKVLCLKHYKKFQKNKIESYTISQLRKLHPNIDYQMVITSKLMDHIKYLFVASFPLKD